MWRLSAHMKKRDSEFSTRDIIATSKPRLVRRASCGWSAITNLELALAEEDGVDPAFGRRDRVRRFRRHRFCQFPRRRHQLIGFHDSVQHTHREQLVGLIMPAPEDRFLGAPRTEPRSEHRRRRATERYLEIDFRHPELGALDRDCKIETECERPSATDRGSVDSANRDLIEIRQHVERAADQARQLFAELVHPPAPLATITCLVLEQRSVGPSPKCGAPPVHPPPSPSATTAHPPPLP